MSLLEFFGLGRKAAPAPQPPAGPMGFSKGSLICIDQDLMLLLGGESGVQVPKEQACHAEGIIDLGQGHWLTRLYLDDEFFWVQFHSTGTRNGQVEAVVLFNYLDCKTVNSRDELKAFAGPSSKVGLPTYEHGGKTYHREWGNCEGQTELIELLEQVTTPSDSYGIKHLSMLYTRETSLSDRKEFLLFSVEEDHEGTISFSTSLGVTLFSTDLKSI